MMAAAVPRPLWTERVTVTELTSILCCPCPVRTPSASLGLPKLNSPLASALLRCRSISTQFARTRNLAVHDLEHGFHDRPPSWLPLASWHLPSCFAAVTGSDETGAPSRSSALSPVTSSRRQSRSSEKR